MKSFLISAGNSSTGPVGFCARVQAETPERALEILREALPEQIEGLRNLVTPEADASWPIEYFIVYFTPANLTVKEDVEDPEGEEVAKEDIIEQ